MTLRILAVAVLLVNSANTAFAQTASRDDFTEFSNAIKGVWISESVVNGEKVTGHAEVDVEEDGKALLIKQYGAESSSVWLVSFDSHTKTITGMLVSSDGSVIRTIAFKDGETWKLKTTAYSEQGEEIISMSSLAISDNGSTHIWTADSGESTKYRRLSDN